jgi:hypothetical protein
MFLESTDVLKGHCIFWTYKSAYTAKFRIKDGTAGSGEYAYILK